MKLYKIIGTNDLEDLTFAQCTTLKKAEKAKLLLEKEGFEDIDIFEDNLTLDTIRIDGELIKL